VKLKHLMWAFALTLACLVALASGGPAQAGTSDAQLLRTYQPVMHLDPAERFRPTSIQSFVTDADLEELVQGTWVVTNPDPGAGDLPDPGTGVWRLNQDSCSPSLPLGGLSCYAAAYDERSGGSVVYGRVAREAGEIVLQYWFFYYDDTYSYLYPPSDFIWQAHEGDWEDVNVVLSSNEQPLSVGYSQHCTGARRAWADTRLWQGTHPIVFVAAGSHANYFDPGTHPIPLQCIPPPAIALLGQLGLPLPVDFTHAGGESEGPPRAGDRVTTIQDVSREAQPWLTYPGFWGELQYFHAPIVGTVALGTSPVGPAYHAEWQDPLATLASWPMG
jgi:hypothetical protein